jgi:hypothetical protein
MTPLIFSRYVRQGVPFTDDPRAQRDAETLRERLQALVGVDALERGVFMGRIGYGDNPSSRSVRMPLKKLWTGNQRMRGPGSGRQKRIRGTRTPLFLFSVSN